MTALFVSTSMTSLSASTRLPFFNKTLITVASAIDSPSWGIKIGT